MYLLLYALTHNTFIFSLMCLGGGTVYISWFVFFADLDIPGVLEALPGGGGWLFWSCAVGVACLMLLVALCIRDTPEANVNLIAICTITLTVIFVMIGFGYTFNVEQATGILGSQNTTSPTSFL
jgi:hypothetical protein